MGVGLQDAPEYANLKGYEVVDSERHDFLFTYYSFRPARLLHWTPGSAELPAEKRPLVESIHRLLVATAGRPANLGCFGMHEWAMVYRLSPDRVRHAAWPLRLGGPQTDRVVESHRIACSQVHATKHAFLWAGYLHRPRMHQPRRLNGGTSVSRW